MLQIKFVKIRALVGWIEDEAAAVYTRSTLKAGGEEAKPHGTPKGRLCGPHALAIGSRKPVLHILNCSLEL